MTHPSSSAYLELGGDLADERDELLQVFGLAVLQHVLGGGGEEGQHLLLHADDHAVQEGAHGAVQRPPLDGTAQRGQEGLQAVSVDLGAAALLHRLLVAERLAGPAGGSVREQEGASGNRRERQGTGGERQGTGGKRQRTGGERQGTGGNIREQEGNIREQEGNVREQEGASGNRRERQGTEGERQGTGGKRQGTGGERQGTGGEHTII